MGIACNALSAFDAVIATGDDQHVFSMQPASSAVVIDTSLIDAWLAGDESGASAAKTTIDTRWIEPLIKQVEQGGLQELEILTEDGQHGLCNTAVMKELARQYAAAQPVWWKRVFARFQ